MADEFERSEPHLEGLGERFMEALEARRGGDVDGAAELLREVLKVEPRLAEPRLELASILLSTGQLDEAEEHVREAIRILAAGGQWTDDLDENVVTSLAYDLLGEALRRRADSDEVVFGDPAVFEELMREASSAFETAARLDPDNEHAVGWAGDFGVSEVTLVRDPVGEA